MKCPCCKKGNLLLLENIQKKYQLDENGYLYGEMIFYGESYLICDMCNTKHPVTSNAEEQNLLLCYPDEKDKQEWQVTADKLKTKMLKILYGIEDEELDKDRRHSLNNFIRETVVPSVIVLAGFLAMIGVLCFL